MTHLEIITRRQGYAPDQCPGTLTVGELIELLEDFNPEQPVYFSNDGGYTYGAITENELEEVEDEDEDEDR